MGSSARTLSSNNAHELAAWCGGRVVVEHDALDHDKTQLGINVPCKDEVKRASLGDMIIHKGDDSFDVYKSV